MDHPRIRGEHPSHVSTLISPKGSSPHTRGARPAPGGAGPGFRIIPAYAGSTARRMAQGFPEPDHPRIRGEHPHSHSGTPTKTGSSPHTRGALAGGLGGVDDLGIIPAYAGSTSPSTPSRNSRPDHPRIRGEHEMCHAEIEDALGSSPHTRGALRGAGGDPVLERIIPAYAGSTA